MKTVNCTPTWQGLLPLMLDLFLSLRTKLNFTKEDHENLEFQQSEFKKMAWAADQYNLIIKDQEPMNFILKAVYYCATNGNRWGKGYTIKEAKRNAGIITAKPSCEYYVMAAMLKDPGEKEFENLYACITANPIDGSPEYYTRERTEEDDKMILKYHVGWLTVEKNY